MSSLRGEFPHSSRAMCHVPVQTWDIPGTFYIPGILYIPGTYYIPGTFYLPGTFQVHSTDLVVKFLEAGWQSCKCAQMIRRHVFKLKEIVYMYLGKKNISVNMYLKGFASKPKHKGRPHVFR